MPIHTKSTAPTAAIHPAIFSRAKAIEDNMLGVVKMWIRAVPTLRETTAKCDQWYNDLGRLGYYGKSGDSAIYSPILKMVDDARKAMTAQAAVDLAHKAYDRMVTVHNGGVSERIKSSNGRKSLPHPVFPGAMHAQQVTRRAVKAAPLGYPDITEMMETAVPDFRTRGYRLHTIGAKTWMLDNITAADLDSIERRMDVITKRIKTYAPDLAVKAVRVYPGTAYTGRIVIGQRLKRTPAARRD